VCGTDFSNEAMQAADVAAAWARRFGEPLVLVHPVDEQPRTRLPGQLRDSLSLFERAQLHRELERLRTMQIEVTEALQEGAPETVLIDEATRHHARLLVLAGKQEGALSRFLAGGLAEQVAEAAPMPTLLVRKPAPLLKWARDARKLRVVVGADLSAPSEAALRWVHWLRQCGPCEVLVVYLQPAAPAGTTTDFIPAVVMDDMMRKASITQAQCFRKKARALLGPAPVRVRVEKQWGYSDAHLIQTATDEKADLLVVGTHSRHGLARLGHHSISRGVLHYAPMNVACIPGRSGEAALQTLRDHTQAPKQ
jgi:nucleotide-binding universal stress UspA family protein